MVRVPQTMIPRSRIFASLIALAVFGYIARPSRAVRTYQIANMLYLESTDGKDTIRVGLDTAWGGAIVLVTYNRRELVNRFDSGREIQLALWDGEQTYDACAGCSGTFGWNPVQAGDRHRHGSVLIKDSLAEDYLYTKTRPIEWFPDNKGGGADRPVATDVIMEQWVTISPWDWRLVHVRYRITYAGQVPHGNSSQELPAVFVNREYDRFVYYAGTTPWTNGRVVDTMLPQAPPVPVLYMPEKWAALVDGQGIGLTVYAPQQYPYGGGRRVPGATGPKGFGLVYYRPLIYYSVLPGRVLTGDYVFVPGDYRVARDLLREIKDSLRTTDMVAPFGYVDTPRAGATVSDSVPVAGWAVDNDSVAKVEVFVDSVDIGTARYGIARPDLRRPYVAAPLNAGYRYVLNTRLLRNGAHTIQVRVTDASGNVAPFKRVPVTVRN